MSVGVWAVLIFLVSIKTLKQYRKLPWNKFVKKKRKFWKTFCSMQKFLELQFLVDHLVDFLELSMFISASLSWLEHERKRMLDTVYFVFLKLLWMTSTNDL